MFRRREGNVRGPRIWLGPVVAIPSAGLRGPRNRVRLLALLQARNEIAYLPGFLRNVAPHVDGIVALDDGSTDGSAEFLASRHEVLELLRVPPERPAWDEVGNHRSLLDAALRHFGDWVICVDADERLERDFRSRAERVIRRGRLFGFSAYQLRLRELWDSTETYRVDGIWGRKRVATIKRREDAVTVDIVVFDPTPPDMGNHNGAYPLRPRTVELPASTQRKRIKINGVPRRAIDLVGQITTVPFAPTDLHLVDGSPEERRRFL